MYRVRTSANQYRKPRGRHCEAGSLVIKRFPSDRANTNIEVCIVTKGFCLTEFELLRTIAS
jgi:hypothetical protein